MKDLSKSDERKAMTALETAIEQVGEGVSPDEALTKVAQDGKFTAQMTQRLIEAYNVSKTLHHLQNEEGEKRASSFALASPSAILGAMFPKDPPTEQKKAAAALHPDYLVGGVNGDFMKAAGLSELPRMTDETPVAYEHDPAALAKKAFDQRNKLTVYHLKAAGLAREAYYRMLGAVDTAASHWRSVGKHEPFELVEKRAAATYGETGRSLMALIYKQGGLDDRRLHVKRASADELGKQQMMFDTTRVPYGDVAEAIEHARDVVQLSKAAARRRSAIHSHAIDHTDILPEPAVVAALEFFMPKEGKRDMPDFKEQDRPAKAKKMYQAMMHRPGEKKRMQQRYGARAEEVAARTAIKHGK